MRIEVLYKLICYETSFRFHSMTLCDTYDYIYLSKSLCVLNYQLSSILILYHAIYN